MSLTLKYQYWRDADGDLFHYRELPDCCRREIASEEKWRVEIECPCCGAYWKSS